MARGFGSKKDSTSARIEVLDLVPVALVLTDPSGVVTSRNAAGAAQTKTIVARYGPGIMEALRDSLAEIVRTSRQFPVRTIAHTMHEGSQVEVSVLVDRTDTGFIGAWDDITQVERARRVASEVSGHLAESSHDLSQLGEELNADVADVSDRADAVAAGAEQLSASIREIAARSANASASTATVVQAAAGASGRLSELDEVAAKIGEVSKLITAIAEQTNLLALNATIEAARAGEAGRGFAVVAGEVKSLAGKTREATDEITAMIDSVQGASGAAVASIQEILGLVAGAREEQEAVSAAVREQSTVAEEMSRSAATVTAAATISARAVARLRDGAAAMAEHSAALTSVVSPAGQA